MGLALFGEERVGRMGLLHLVEGARVVALAAILIRAFSFDDHCVVGEALDRQIDVLSNLTFVVVGIVGVCAVEFVSRQRIAVVVLPDIAGVVSVEGDVAMSVVGILEVPSADEFRLIDR